VRPHLVIATRNAHKVDEIKAVLGDRFVYHTLRDFPAAPEVDETGNTFEANARLKSEALGRWLLSHRDSIEARAPLDGPTTPNSSADATQTAPSHPASETFAASAPWFVLADDSGLEVNALGGAPGVQSARFAAAEFGLEGNAPDGANNAKLLRLLDHVPAESRTARFRCVLAFTPVAAGVSPQGIFTPVSTPEVSQDSTHFFSGACEGRIGFVPRGSHGFGYDPLFIPEGFTETLAELGDALKNRISHRSQALQALQALLVEICEGRTC